MKIRRAPVGLWLLLGLVWTFNVVTALIDRDWSHAATSALIVGMSLLIADYDRRVTALQQIITRPIQYKEQP